jgi:hypothetical protein
MHRQTWSSVISLHDFFKIIVFAKNMDMALLSSALAVGVSFQRVSNLFLSIHLMYSNQYPNKESTPTLVLILYHPYYAK